MEMTWELLPTLPRVGEHIQLSDTVEASNKVIATIDIDKDPSWELLPTLPRVGEHIQLSDTVEASNKVIATIDIDKDPLPMEDAHDSLRQLQVLTPSEVPDYKEWQVDPNLAFVHNNQKTFFSLNPVVMEKIEELDKTKHQGPARFMQKHELPFILAEIGIPVVVGGERAYVWSGGDFKVGIIGAVGGIVSGFGITFGCEAAVEKRLDIVERRKQDIFADVVAGAADSYAVPNESVFGQNLGEVIVRILQSAEDPRTVLNSKLLPLIRTIMDAGVEFDAVNAEIAQIKERSSTLGGVIKRDKKRMNQLKPKRDELTRAADESISKLNQFREAQIDIEEFKNVLGEIDEVKTSVAPDINEFNEGLSLALQSVFTPGLLEISTEAIRDWIKLIKTFDDAQLLQPVYNAFVEKYREKGLSLPDFEALQEQIAKNRELR